ncbi:MAG: hypothetical protein Q4G05_00510 [Clostridia bacterium]|nr:hypothetical protein [Clostridia bacterium]
MLILAGIAINLTLGENGIFNKAKDAKTEYEAAATNESTMLDNLNADLTANVDGDFE